MYEQLINTITGYRPTPLNVRVTIVILLLCILTVSCSADNTQDKEVLKKAREIADNDPDSAMDLLSDIMDPGSLDRESYMHYLLTEAHVKFASKIDITKDSTTLGAIRKYFITEKEDYSAVASASLLLGNINYVKGDKARALADFLGAKYYAQKTNDELVKGKVFNNIGYLYYVQEMMDSAIVNTKQALESFNNAKETGRPVLVATQTLASAYYAIRDYDNALLYYKSGLILAINSNNKYFINIFMQHIGATYWKLKEYDEALLYLNKVLDAFHERRDNIRTYYMLTKLYEDIGHVELSVRYATLIEENIAKIEDDGQLRDTYLLLERFFREEKNYQKVLQYSEIVSSIDQRINKRKRAKELEEAYKTHQTELDKEKDMRLNMAGALLTLSIVGTGGAIYYRKNKFQLKSLLNNRDSDLIKTENKLMELKANNLDLLLNNFTDILDCRRRIISKIDQCEINEGHKKWLMGGVEHSFESFRESTDRLFTDWCRSEIMEHPSGANVLLSLSGQELRLMYLSYLEYTERDIATLLGISYDMRDMQYRVKAIKNKLKAAGMNAREVESMF